MGRRTQLICIWIFICQQTNRKDIAGQSAKLDTWERLKKTAPRWCCLQPALKANPVAKFKVELPALQRWGRSEERGDQRKGELHWARQMFERPQDDESQPEQWAVQGGVRLQLADWLSTSLANTTEILYSNPPPNLPDLGPHVVELDQYQNVPYSHSDFSDVYFSFAKWCSRSWKEPVPFNFDWIALNLVMILTIWPLPHPLLNEEHMFYFVLDFGDHFCNFFLLPLIYGLMRNTFILIMQMSSAKHNTNIDFFFLDN